MSWWKKIGNPLSRAFRKLRDATLDAAIQRAEDRLAKLYNKAGLIATVTKEQAITAPTPLAPLIAPQVQDAIAAARQLDPHITHEGEE